MFLPVRTDSPLRSTPWMNWALILANCAVWVVQQRVPWIEELWRLSPAAPVEWPWQYLSYAFVHRDGWHLISNMLFLYIFGNNVNDKMGSAGYLAFYLAGAVTAGIGHMLTETAAVIGASGAVSAVTGAYLVLFPRSNVTVIYFLFIVVGATEIASMYLIVFFFAQDLVLNVIGQQDIAYTAHLTGSLFGFTLCVLLLVVHLLPRDQFDVVALIQRWNKRRQYQSLVKQGYDPFGYVPPVRMPAAEPAPPANPALQRIQDLRAEIAEAIAHHNHPHAAILYLELKTLDPNQVLSRQAQLEVANQLASQQFYPQAAETYEQFLKHYPNYDQIEQVQLMLGLIYARYLEKSERARELLLRALARLSTEREVELARAELTRLDISAALRPTN